MWFFTVNLFCVQNVGLDALWNWITSVQGGMSQAIAKSFVKESWWSDEISFSKNTSHLWNTFLEDSPFTMFSWKSVPYGISQYFVILQLLTQTTSCNLWMFFCVSYHAWVLTLDTYVGIFLIPSFFCSCCDDSFLSDVLLALIMFSANKRQNVFKI